MNKRNGCGEIDKQNRFSVVVETDSSRLSLFQFGANSGPGVGRVLSSVQADLSLFLKEQSISTALTSPIPSIRQAAETMIQYMDHANAWAIKEQARIDDIRDKKKLRNMSKRRA